LIERARNSRAPELQSLISEAAQLDDLEELAGGELMNKAAVAAATLATENVRYLETFEHPAILERALDESKEKLLIVAPWIRPAVVDASFLDRLETLLKRDVRVVIAWGIDSSTKAKDADPRILAKLEQLAARFKKLTVHWLGNTHAKVLISDNSFVVAGSFNWLSFKGDPAQTFRDERSFLIAHGPTVRRAFEIEMKKLGLKP
jgi:phosphatidylserine/phosphatidylglycerophosphate/cardiolipin synthase-like enzyme